VHPPGFARVGPPHTQPPHPKNIKKPKTWLRTDYPALQVIDTTSPLGIQECFQLVDQSNSLRSRTTKTLLVPHCLTTATMRMSAYLVLKIHSALPLFLKEQSSLSLKTAFFMVKMSDYSVFSCNRRKCYSCGVAAAMTQN
jgi:hypothetical protein